MNGKNKEIKKPKGQIERINEGMKDKPAKMNQWYVKPKPNKGCNSLT